MQELFEKTSLESIKEVEEPLHNGTIRKTSRKGIKEIEEPLHIEEVHSDDDSKSKDYDDCKKNTAEEVSNKLTKHDSEYKISDSSYINCEICNFSSKNKDVLSAHSRIHNIGHFCTICGYESLTRSKLEDHVGAHSNKHSFQCVLCKERLVNNRNFESHLNEHICKISKCYWCTFTSENAIQLREHLEYHIIKLKKSCQQCDYFCFFEKENQIHKEIHESAAITIPASRIFPEQTNLSRDNEKKFKNIQKKTKNQLIKKKGFYRCTICGDILDSQDELMFHCTKHISGMMHTCHICDYTTDQNGDIHAHVTDHLPLIELTAV